MLSMLDTSLKYVALGTFVFAIFQHFSNERAQLNTLATEKALTYIESYASGPVSDALKSVAKFWQEHIPIVVRNNREMSEADLARVFRSFIISNIDYHAYQHSLNAVLSHLDIVAFCAREQICNVSLINSFYCPEYDNLRKVFATSRDYYRREGINVGLSSSNYFSDNCD